MTELSLPLIIGAALVDGINPCAFGVLIFLLAYLSKTFHNRNKMLIHGLVYILAVGLTYFVAGLILLPVINQLRAATIWVYYSLAGLIGLAGLLELKDFFWYGQGPTLAISFENSQLVKKYTAQISGRLSTAFGLGVFVSLVELPCTGAVYLAVLTLMSEAGLTLTNLNFLVLYNLMMVVPLIVILWLVWRGSSTTRFRAWQKRHKPLMRLAVGLLLIGLAVWMYWLV